MPQAHIIWDVGAEILLFEVNDLKCRIYMGKNMHWRVLLILLPKTRKATCILKLGKHVVCFSNA
jgi:hypothetical protein